jgi:TonB family protein
MAMHEFLMMSRGGLLHPALDSLLHYFSRSAVSLGVVGAAAWLGDRMLRKVGPQAQHRMWVAALLTGVALPLLPTDLLVSYIGHAEARGEGGTVSVTYNTIAAVAEHWTLPPLLATIAAAVYLLTVLLSMARLLSRWRRTWTMARRASVVPPDALVHGLLEDAARRFEVAEPEVRCSTETRGPVVLGLHRAMLLVPESFLGTENDEDVAAALAHECAHLARRDFAKNLIYECVAVLVAYHPACWLMRRRIAETRELVCDEMAADAVGDRPEYAASLLRLATGMAAAGTPVSHAVGVLDANILEERIMRMTMDVPRVGRARKIAMAVVASSALLGGAVTAVAVPFDVGAQNATQEKVYKIGGDVTPPVLIDAPDAVFPAAKKKSERAGWSGVSIVQLIVDGNGMPREVHITRSLAPDFDRSAMDAVRQYRFKPGMRKGEPVAVAITIVVNFRLY